MIPLMYLRKSKSRVFFFHEKIWKLRRQNDFYNLICGFHSKSFLWKGGFSKLNWQKKKNDFEKQATFSFLALGERASTIIISVRSFDVLLSALEIKNLTMLKRNEDQYFKKHQKLQNLEQIIHIDLKKSCQYVPSEKNKIAVNFENLQMFFHFGWDGSKFWSSWSILSVAVQKKPSS